MFSDQISSTTSVVAGDMVYIYPYNKRKLIKSFDDLMLVRVQATEPVTRKTDNLIVSGSRRHAVDGHFEDESISGVVEYVRNGDIVRTSEGDKIINYFIQGKKPIRCLKNIDNEFDYCRLRAILQIDKNTEIKVEPYDLICTGQDNLKSLIGVTNITYPRLHNGYVSFFLNGDEKIFDNFSVYIKDIKFKADDAQRQIFQWACNNKNSINDAIYNFQKVFSLKLVGFELVKSKLYKN